MRSKGYIKIFKIILFYILSHWFNAIQLKAKIFGYNFNATKLR